MRHRVRAAAMMVKDGRILLVQHVHPDTGEEWWVPPGGGIEAVDDDLFACVKREVWEETGLDVKLGRIVYIREFLEEETNTYHLELFLSTSDHAGELTIRNIQGTGPDEHYIKNVRWLARNEIQEIIVYPEMLKDEFWDDLAAGFPETRYLGKSNG